MPDKNETVKLERWPSTRRIGTRLTGRFDRDAWEAVERQPGLGGDCDGSCQHPRPIFVLCEACGSEGRIYTGSYEDERDLGECPVCHGTGREEVEGEQD